MSSALRDDSTATYYLKTPYRFLALVIIAFGAIVGWLILSGFSAGDFSADRTGVFVFALIMVMAMFDLCLWIGYRLLRIRLVVSARGITYYAIGYSIRSTWDNVASLETVPTRSGSVQGLVLRQPGLNINSVMGTLMSMLPLLHMFGFLQGHYIPDGSIDERFIPIGPFESEQVQTAIQRFAPQVSDTTSAAQPIGTVTEPLAPERPSALRRIALVFGVLAIEIVFMVVSVQAWQGGITPLQTLQLDYAPIGFTFINNGQNLLVVNSVGDLQTWRVNDGTLQQTRPLTHSVASFAVSADGQAMAAGLDDGTVQVWRADGQAWYSLGQSVKVPCPPCGSTPPVAFSPDGQNLAAGSYAGIIHVWDLRDGTERLTLKAPTDTANEAITSLAFSPDGQQLIAGAQSLVNSVQFWQVASGELVGAYPGQYVPDEVSFTNSVQFSADGQQLAVATLKHGIWLLTLADRKRNVTLNAPTTSDPADIVLAAFSPDTQYVVSASTSGALQIWRLADKKLLRTLRVHTKGIQQLAFSPDGQYLATGAQDNTVRVWRVADLVK
ncbi:MAG: WD40 repeat domain-containing protein [Anaerolineae bacterium]